MKRIQKQLANSLRLDSRTVNRTERETIKARVSNGILEKSFEICRVGLGLDREWMEELGNGEQIKN